MSKIILNHVDLDAAGCRIVIDYLGYEYDKMLFCDYNQFDLEENFNMLLDYDTIVCTDYSLSVDVVMKLLNLGKMVEVYDHHESSELLKEIVHPNFKLVHSKIMSGTKIVFNSFKKNIRYKKSLIQFVELVNCYDMFDETSPLWEEAQNMNRVLWNCVNWNSEEDKFTFIFDYWLHKIDRQSTWTWSAFEKTKIEKAIKVENEEYIKSKVSFKILEDAKGLKFGVTVATKKVSIIANRLLKDFPSISYIAIINTYTGWNKISLRSRDEKEFDCTRIANGHKCAAGLEVEEELAKGLYAGTHQLQYKEDLNE
jgi:oligoribonuclease NrnB/cAMP/cGMP phosphodiesterase (DHH superfamily)